MSPGVSKKPTTAKGFSVSLMFWDFSVEAPWLAMGRLLGGVAAVPVVRVGLREHALHFADGDHRQEADEEHEQREEEAEGPDEGRDVDDRRLEVAPARREEVPVERGRDDHEALEPHA